MLTSLTYSVLGLSAKCLMQNYLEEFMAKRKRKIDKKKQKKWLENDGRGLGRFENYKPYLTSQDVATTGLGTRILGTKINRLHHMFSNIELDYFYIVDWSEDIIDIREQYPLDLPETLALAKEYNLRHIPLTDPKNPLIMTTDFLLTVRQPIGTIDIARTIKPSKDLDSSRTLEKLEIERLYWKERNINWGIVTELDIDKTLVKNIKWLYPCHSKQDLPESISSEIFSKLEKYILPLVSKKKLPLRNITRDCDKKFKLKSGTSLIFVRHMIAGRKWTVNMHKPIQPEKVLSFVSSK